MKKLLLILMTLPFFANAQSVETIPDVVKLVGPYEITTQQAQSSVVHLYLPSDTTGVIGIQGEDKFADYSENTSHFSLSWTDDRKTVFMKNSMSAGSTAVFGVTTECGVSISIALHSIDLTKPENEIKPKLSLLSSPCDKS